MLLGYIKENSITALFFNNHFVEGCLNIRVINGFRRNVAKTAPTATPPTKIKSSFMSIPYRLNVVLQLPHLYLATTCLSICLPTRLPIAAPVKKPASAPAKPPTAAPVNVPTPGIIDPILPPIAAPV